MLGLRSRTNRRYVVVSVSLILAAVALDIPSVFERMLGRTTEIVGAKEEPVAASEVYSADLALYESEENLIAASQYVVVGTPVGDPRVVDTPGPISAYYQRFQVDETLRGSPVNAVTVVRAGLDPGVGSEGGTDGASETRTVVTADGGGELGGPLERVPQVLLLQPSGDPSAWSVTGHYQGALITDSGGTLAGAYEDAAVPDSSPLNGLTLERLRELVAAPELQYSQEHLHR